MDMKGKLWDVRDIGCVTLLKRVKSFCDVIRMRFEVPKMNKEENIEGHLHVEGKR